MLTKDKLASVTLPDSGFGGLSDTVPICAVKLELYFSALLFLPYAVDCI